MPDVLAETLRDLAAQFEARLANATRNLEAREAEVIALRGRYERASHESNVRLHEIERLAARVATAEEHAGAQAEECGALYRRVQELEDRDADEDLRVNIRALQHELHEARALRDTALRKLDSAEYRLEKMRTDRDEWRSSTDAASELAQIRAIVAERDAAQRAAAAWSREAADRGVALDVLKAGLRNLLDEVTPKGDDV